MVGRADDRSASSITRVTLMGKRYEVDNGNAAVVEVKDGAVLHLDDCKIVGGRWGCRVAGSTVQIVNSQISGSMRHGVRVQGCSQVKVKHSRVFDNDECGFYINQGATVALEDCQILDNQMNGMVVEDDWAVEPSGRYKQVGYKCTTVDLNQCVIDGSGHCGLHVAARTTKAAGRVVARLRACTITNSSRWGLGVDSFGLAELVDCQIVGAGIGVQCTRSSKVCLQKCTISESEIAMKMWDGGHLLLSQSTFHDNIQEAEITDADTIDFEESL